MVVEVVGIAEEISQGVLAGIDGRDGIVPALGAVVQNTGVIAVEGNERVVAGIDDGADIVWQARHGDLLISPLSPWIELRALECALLPVAQLRASGSCFAPGSGGPSWGVKAS